MFSSIIGASVVTGYDWTATSSETMAEEESFQETADAQPGEVLNIEQVEDLITSGTD